MTSRSFKEWVEAAARAQDPAEADRCLDEAIALADRAWYWQRIVEAAAAWQPPRPERVRALADHALGVALDQPDVWCFREIARARDRVLGDRAGALEALELAVVAFDGDRWGGRPWTILADGFTELGDPGGARRVLDHGVETARVERKVDHLAELARAYAKLGDAAAADACAAEAEAMLAGGVDGAWGLANTWEQLGKLDAAVRVLEAATGGAQTTSEALTVARAWVHHGGAVGQPRALARAEALAAGFDDWMALADGAHDLGRDELTRHALERALPLAGTDGDQRARVAAGYQRWLGDEAAAEAIGPRGLRPEALAPGIAADLAGWACAPAALFDWLRPRVTRRMLEHIATADYGIDYDQHLAAIADLCATGLVPRRLGWNPGEVVELRRWQEGTDVDHVERALCCTLLCLASDPALDTNGAILVESVVALGAEAMDLAAGLIAWCDARRRAEWAAAELDEEHDPWALVTLAVLAAARDPADARLPGLVALVTAHHRAPELPERRARSLRPRLWEELVARHVAPHAAQVPALADLLAILELRPPAEA